eukprot:5374321-Prymnesium_polylepis.1
MGRLYCTRCNPYGYAGRLRAWLRLTRLDCKAYSKGGHEPTPKQPKQAEAFTAATDCNCMCILPDQFRWQC